MNHKSSFRTLYALLILVLLSRGAYPNLAAADSWSFAVLGDQQSPYTGTGVNTPIATAMALQVATQNPAFVLVGGDNILGVALPGLSLAQQYANWKTATAPILGISYSVRGNHEAFGAYPGYPDQSPTYATNTQAWQQNMGNMLQIPQNGPPGEVGMSYSFSKNNVFIIGLDESANPYQVNQTWLNAQLQANTLPFTFVYGHYPAFGLNVSESYFLSQYPAQRDAFWQSLGNNSVNIYLTAHVHLYDRAMISINGGPEIQQIILGAGGAPLETTWDGTYQDPRVIGEKSQQTSYGYSLVTVNGNTVTVVYYVYDQTTNTWSAFDTYTYTMTSRNFGANDANQAIDPATLTKYYQGINLIKIGQGTLTLNLGASTYANTITVSAGTVNVQGNYPNAPVNVEAGGTLSGIGTIGSVTNNGTVSPGNSPGTLNVVGTYTQTSSGTLRVEIASSTDYDKINVTGASAPAGTARLNGTVAPVLLGGYRPLVNQVFSGVVTTTNGVTGTFSNISQPLTLNWQPVYNANQVDLLFQPNYSNPALGLTPNGQSVGNMLQGVAWSNPTGDLAEVLNNIDSLGTAAAVGDAYKQISPEKAGALATLSFAGATAQFRSLAQRITDLRFESRNLGSALGPGSFGLNYSRESGLMLAYNSSSLAGLLTGTKRPASPENRWGLYLEPNLILGNQKSTANQTGFAFTSAGFTCGADYRVRDDLLVGLATGYSRCGANFRDSGGSVENNTWPLLAYAAYLPPDLYAFGSLSYNLNLFTLERGITFGGLNRTAKGSLNGNQFNGYGEAGYDLKAWPFLVTPLVSLAYSRLRLDGFTESGADSLNLKVSPQNAHSLQTGVGGKVAVPLKRDSIVFIPQLYATYQHEFSNRSRGLDARLSQGSSAINWQTDKLRGDFAVVGGDLTINMTKNLSVRANYNAEVGRGNYTAHFANAGLRYEF